MRNPDKYLRAAYLEALTAAGLTVYLKKIPPSVSPIPQEYILITSQTKTTTERSKTDFEWISRITLNIVKINASGYASTTTVDDMEEICISVIESGFIMDTFAVKSTYQIDSMNLDIEGPNDTVTIERRVLLYEHWVSQLDGENVGLPYILTFNLS